MSVRRSLLLLVAVPFLALTACSGSGEKFSYAGSDGQIVPVAKRLEAPVLSGESLDGGTASIADSRGTVTVVNLWGSWCPPCQEEAPALAQVAKDNAAAVKFFGIDTRDTGTGAKKFQSTYEHNWPSIADTEGSVSAKWTPLPANGIPVTVLLDKQGRVASRFVGPLTYSELTKAVNALTAEQ